MLAGSPQPVEDPAAYGLRVISAQAVGGPAPNESQEAREDFSSKGCLPLARGLQRQLLGLPVSPLFTVPTVSRKVA